MSLRDDLDLMARAADYGLGAPDFLDAYKRLYAALSPAAIKWLEALPELLEAKAARMAAAKLAVTMEAPEKEWDAANETLTSLFEAAISEAAVLHAAASAVNAGTDNKEQK